MSMYALPTPTSTLLPFPPHPHDQVLRHSLPELAFSMPRTDSSAPWLHQWLPTVLSDLGCPAVFQQQLFHPLANIGLSSQPVQLGGLGS